MELVYPLVIFIGIIILIILIVLKLKRKDVYKDGKKIANTKYVKSLPYYKEVIKRYKVLTNIIKIVCLVCIFLSLVLIARPVVVENTSSSMYNRDIFLCMDVSTSVNELNEELVKNLKKVVSSLEGERFGITIFNTSSILLVPLTDDYEYVNSVLDTLSESFRVSEGDSNFSDESLYYRNYIQSGTLVGNEDRGSSIIGDGLASCIYNFSNIQEERTRIIIFSTDNDLQGKEIVTLQEAADLARNNNITVFGIGPEAIEEDEKEDLKKAVEKTGGTYYTESFSSTVSNIVSNIEQKGKSLIKGKKEVRKIDKPQIPFIMLMISLFILFILNKKVNL